MSAEAGNSCHQCKNNKPLEQLIFCMHQGDPVLKLRKCRKKFCFACLGRSYNIFLQEIPDVNEWLCPACLGQCTCATCRRSPAAVAVANPGSAGPEDAPSTSRPSKSKPKKNLNDHLLKVRAEGGEIIGQSGSTVQSVDRKGPDEVSIGDDAASARARGHNVSALRRNSKPDSRLQEQKDSFTLDAPKNESRMSRPNARRGTSESYNGDEEDDEFDENEEDGEDYDEDFHDEDAIGTTVADEERIQNQASLDGRFGSSNSQGFGGAHSKPYGRPAGRGRRTASGNTSAFHFPLPPAFSYNSLSPAVSPHMGAYRSIAPPPSGLAPPVSTPNRPLRSLPTGETPLSLAPAEYSPRLSALSAAAVADAAATGLSNTPSVGAINTVPLSSSSSLTGSALNGSGQARLSGHASPGPRSGLATLQLTPGLSNAAMGRVGSTTSPQLSNAPNIHVNVSGAALSRSVTPSMETRSPRLTALSEAAILAQQRELQQTPSPSMASASLRILGGSGTKQASVHTSSGTPSPTISALVSGLRPSASLEATQALLTKGQQLTRNKPPNDFVLGQSAGDGVFHTMQTGASTVYSTLSSLAPSASSNSLMSVDSNASQQTSTSANESQAQHRSQQQQHHHPEIFEQRVYTFDFRSMPSSTVVKADGTVRLTGVDDIGMDYVSVYGKVVPRLPFLNDNPPPPSVDSGFNRPSPRNLEVPPPTTRAGRSSAVNDLNVMDTSLISDIALPTPVTGPPAPIAHEIPVEPDRRPLPALAASTGFALPNSSMSIIQSNMPQVYDLRLPPSVINAISVPALPTGAESPSPLLPFSELNTPPLGVAQGSFSPATLSDLASGFGGSVPTIPLTNSISLNTSVVVTTHRSTTAVNILDTIGRKRTGNEMSFSSHQPRTILQQLDRPRR